MKQSRVLHVMLLQFDVETVEAETDGNDLMDDEVFDQLQHEITNGGGDCQ